MKTKDQILKEQLKKRNINASFNLTKEAIFDAMDEWKNQKVDTAFEAPDPRQLEFPFFPKEEKLTKLTDKELMLLPTKNASVEPVKRQIKVKSKKNTGYIVQYLKSNGIMQSAFVRNSDQTPVFVGLGKILVRPYNNEELELVTQKDVNGKEIGILKNKEKLRIVGYCN